MNLPNKLTCVRVILTVIFLVFIFSEGPVFKTLALVVFLAAAWTDYWDGKIAREQGTITHFGQLMDPIADKLLVLSAFIAFVQMNLVPAWMVVLIVVRDLLVTGTRFSMPAGPSQSARPSGKLKTALQFAVIIGILLFLIARETPYWRLEWEAGALGLVRVGMLFIVAMTLWSGISYLARNKQSLN